MMFCLSIKLFGLGIANWKETNAKVMKVTFTQNQEL